MTTDEAMEPTELELRSVDPSRGRARRYRMATSRTLFGELGLLITWGRIGGPTRVRLETFGSATKLDERREQLLTRRRAHGYEIHPRVYAVDTPTQHQDSSSTNHLRPHGPLRPGAACPDQNAR